jgi:integrase
VAESRPRRGHGEDSIYYDQANHYWVAAVSLGYKGGKRVRRKVTGRTKTEVRTKLRDLRHDLDHGVRPRATYTVGDGVLWQDHDLVFASAVGTPLDRHNVLRELRKITQAAGLGTVWVPREMRYTFVSLLSSNGTALEDIADLVGHRGTATTETVYRKVIVPELRRGAEVMDRLFSWRQAHRLMWRSQ